ncbi:hypothetical protein Z042_21630 [Chania multitudinisentens RB-25]|uniref:Uncharacterized protein n=1 Tax=Chania multitudinisentens RB-25 TaxID=1441930 RepID=W0LIW8_9GAMM|nr:chitinase [Chania multitudinisentens]AHG21920.1 hypothetical protein Z042_21630 [Chania multitudinisentens RB-25]
MTKTKFAPFIDVSINAEWSDWQNYPQGRPNKIYSDAAINIGIDMLFFGFLTAASNNQACWSAQPTMPIDWAQPLAQELIAGGVKVAVSFGGAANADISNVMTVEQLITVYQQVIDQLGATHLDFDFENGLYNEDKAFVALQSIKAKNPSVTMSLTLPIMPTGLTGVGLALVQKAKAAGLQMKINGMAMDYYSPSHTEMGVAAVQAATSLKEQLAVIYPTLTEAQLYEKVQITPMIGINDDGTLFKFADIDILTAFAKTNAMDLIAIWSLTRDNPGGGQWADAEHSGNPEQTTQFEYSTRFVAALK